MKRWFGFAIFALAACSPSTDANRDRPAEKPYRPNVLLIVVDALRADTLGINGYPLPTSPNIDALAAEGANFARTYSHSTWTKPAMASLFTSTYPIQHGLNRVAFLEESKLSTDVLAGTFTTMAEHFSAAGYDARAYVNQVHLQEKFGFAQGFEQFAAARGSSAYKLNYRFLTWLDKREANSVSRPFLAYLHYLEPHWPYDRRRPDLPDELQEVQMESEPPRSGFDVPAWLEAGLSGADLAALRARYDREVAVADGAIGLLWSELRKRGLTRDLLVVVTSDHGEAFLEHGHLLHGHAPYEEEVRVPLVLRLPERLRPAAERLDDPVGLIDVLPTLSELCALEPPEGAMGRSLVPLLRGETLPDRSLFIETAEGVAVVAGTSKLIRFADDSLAFVSLDEDPGESRPATECVGACREMAATLRTYFRLPRLAGGEAANLTREEIDDLRDLGYLN